jgi:hypothetical protein
LAHGAIEKRFQDAGLCLLPSPFSVSLPLKIIFQDGLAVLTEAVMLSK